LEPRETKRVELPQFRIAALAIAAVVIAVLWGLYRDSRLAEDRLLERANDALSSGDYDTAQDLAEKYLQHVGDDSEAMLIAGRAAAMADRTDESIQFLDRAAESGATQAVAELFQVGRNLLLDGQAGAAEQCLRRVLRHDADHALANDHLVYLLRIEGRLWEARQPLLALFRLGRFVPTRGGNLMVAEATDYLVAASTTEFFGLRHEDARYSEMCHNRVSDDFLPYLGQARQDVGVDDVTAAETVFQQVAGRRPDLIEAQVGVGTVLLKRGNPDGFLEWRDRLPGSAKDHPDVWFLHGLFAERYGKDIKTAASCYNEAVRRHPGHRHANYRLARSLVALGNEGEAAVFSEHAAQLAKLEYAVRVAVSEPQRIREVVDLLESLGRFYEAAGWCQVAVKQNVDVKWAGAQMERLRKKSLHLTTLVDPDFNPGPVGNLAKIALSDLQLSIAQTESPIPIGQTRLRFKNDAKSVGLDFSYFNGAEHGDKRAWMFEFSGGGVGVIDFDHDGWPDIYLTQGCRWPPERETGSHHDQIFRNLTGSRFQDVTEPTGLGDRYFTTGATCGDFDGDGFDDIYVSNIGFNTTYRNNGDGTFSEMPPGSGPGGDDWTISSVMADLNGDGLADVYAVNYLSGDVLERECTDRGRPVQCYPTSFPGAQDRIYLNRGDGTFEDVTASAGVTLPDGKGMGVVAADLDGSGRLSLYVANDTTANYLLVNRTANAGDSPVFEEQALLSGVALGADGQAQSGMGIAAGDVNSDGRIDFFVTNYYLEANNLFVQIWDGQFEDQARQARLGESAYNRLGWGAQFLDCELDGDCDLIVANGHLDDYSDEGVPYRMTPACYENQGASQFHELDGATVGNYFATRHLGRAVARMDWNRDGLPDVVVTHVDSPVALLTNCATNPGAYVAIRLVGTQSERCAFGTRIQIDCGRHSWTQQLTAGDGFAASNERCLVFGLGDAERIDTATITWPSGQIQVFQSLETNLEYTIIEGSLRPWTKTK
jgi:tetratricopeptide (TPR) repeat protein